MFQFIPVREDNIYAVRVSGRVTHEDYQAFLPELDKLIEDNDTISLFVELDQFEGADFAALKDDFNFGMSHQEKFKKIAVVGDKLWERWGVAISQPFVKAKMKYFAKGDAYDAWDWLRSDQLLDQALDDADIVDYQRILVAVDFSKNARYAAHRAKSMAQRFDAEVQFVHVINETVINDAYYQPLGLGIVADNYEVEATLMKRAKDQLGELLKELELPSGSGTVLIGEPVNSIVSYAQAQQADLIVLGTRSRRGIGSLIGSTTNYVSSHAQCDVLAVPLPANIT